MAGMSRTTGAVLDGRASIEQSVADILGTRVGSRCGRREYGSLLPDLLDQPRTAANILRLYAATALAISRWEDRLRLKSVALAAGDGPGSSALILDAERTDISPANARTPRAVSTAIIGLVATASDADEDTFPLDTPVLVSDVETAIGKAGTEGTLARSLRAIADQARAVVVVVRVEDGADDDETATNVIGTTTAAGAKTGMQALLNAKALLGVKPKILGTPGLETQAVTAALVVVAQKLRGFAYARAIGDTVEEAQLYRANFSQRELMLLVPDFLAWDTATSAAATSFAAARAMGLRAYLDETYGPQKTLSNVPVNGVVGTTAALRWDIEDQTSEAALLNAKEITALVRTDAGFIFWGNRTTAATETEFAFESTVRVAQLLADTVAQGLLWGMDKPLTPSLAKDIVETVNGFGRQLKAAGVVLGFNAWFDEANNSVASLKAGKLRIEYDYTVPPPLEDLGFIQRITDSYLADFAGQLTEEAA